jgi:hypothetical protein
MSTEHPRHHTEHHRSASAEINSQLEAAKQEALTEIRRSAETTAEHPDKRLEAARAALNQPEQPQVAAAETAPPAAAKPFRPMLNHRLNYLDTLMSLQRRLTPTSRQFSKFIHTPIIESTSEALERTIARPSLMLGATWTALIVGGTFYFTARAYGYILSGSELLFASAVGAGLGLLGEALWRALHHR